MRRQIITLAVFALVGCSRAPDPIAVADAAKVNLQKQLDTNRGGEHLVVKKVDVVALQSPKFDGSATISNDGQDFTIPISISDDGHAAIVSFDDNRMSSEINSSTEKRIAELGNLYSDAVLNPKFIKLFTPSLQSNVSDFKGRLEVVSPIERRKEYFFGHGCKAHECGSNEAAWTINAHTGSAVALIMMTSTPDTGSMVSFGLYGATLADLPEPLREWGLENGLNQMNVGEHPNVEPAIQG